MISVIELIILYIISDNQEGSSSFSILRSLRLFRIFKMAKGWRSLNSIIRTMTNAVTEIGNFAILLLLFMFTYALVGMQLFSNRFHFNSETGATIYLNELGYESASVPRSNFDNFFRSMITVFQLLTGENWNSIMYDGLKVRSWVAAAYFISLVVLGVFIVMNLFLAILLKRFDGSEYLIDNSISKSVSPSFVENQSPNRTACPKEGIKSRASTIEILWQKFGKSHPFRRLCFQIVDTREFDLLVTVLIVLSSVFLALDNPLVDPNSMRIRWIKKFDVIFTIIFLMEMVAKIFAYGFVLEKGAYLRDTWNLVDFSVAIISLLNLASIGPGKALRVLRTLRVLRPLRMINRLPELKVVVDALIMSFPSVANVAILCILFYMIFASFGVNFLKGSFHHCNGDTFSSLSNDQISYLTNPREWGSLSALQQKKYLTNTSQCLATDWIPSTIPTSKEICNCLAPGEWINVIPQNFDNILSGMALLFEISTTERWVDVMYAAIDQRGINMQPIRDNNILWALFFIIFLLIGAFFMLELFVGVTIDNFNKIRENTGRGLMTDAQKEWAATQAFVIKIKPEKRLHRPNGRFRGWCYDLIMPNINPMFQNIVTWLVLMNCICISLVEFGESQSKEAFLEYCNYAFALIFTCEVSISILALHQRYFDDMWNRFDFVVVCGSNIGLLINMIFPHLQQITALVRLFRIFRVIRLLRLFKKFRTLLNTMVVSIPSIINIGSLLFLLFFMYAVCGMQLYSFIPENEHLNKHASFRSFGKSMMLLLRFSTGEDWNGFMRSIIPDKEGCIIDPLYNATSPWCFRDEDYPTCTEINGCGAGYSAFIYFYSFTLIVSFVILNLFVGVVLEAFESSAEGDILEQDDLDQFTSIWTSFDPDASWYIKAEDVQRLVLQLDTPLGVANSSTENVAAFMKDQCILEIPVNDEGKVNIVHVAAQLAKRAAKQVSIFYPKSKSPIFICIFYKYMHL